MLYTYIFFHHIVQQLSHNPVRIEINALPRNLDHQNQRQEYIKAPTLYGYNFVGNNHKLQYEKFTRHNTEMVFFTIFPSSKTNVKRKHLGFICFPFFIPSLAFVLFLKNRQIDFHLIKTDSWSLRNLIPHSEAKGRKDL